MSNSEIKDHQVFLSYAMGEDSGVAHRLAKDLRDNGYEVWIAPNSILPGEEWVPAINQGIEGSQYFIVLLNSKAIESQWVHLEMNTAIELERSGQIRIIPLQQEICELPALWRSYQAIPFQIYSVGFQSLLESLHSPFSVPSSTSVFSAELSLLTKMYHQGGISSLVFFPNGDLIVGGRNGEIRVWKIPEGREINKLSAHEKTLTDMALSSTGDLLATASQDNTVHLWELPNINRVGTLIGHEGTVTSIDISPDGKQLVSGSRDATVRVWTIPDGETIRILRKHSKSVYGVAFSPDSQLIASASSDNTVILWSVKDDFEGNELGKSASTTLLRSIFSPDGELLAVGTWSGVIRLWNVINRSSAGILEGHRDRVYGLGFSPDGSILASGSKDGYLRLWNISEKSLAYPPFEAHGGWIRSVAFSPDGDILATGDSDGIVALWGVKHV